ncbi:hypothetical protein [Vagococcus fessus]|nr:hypothetical protein [Vagococcus fessus]
MENNITQEDLYELISSQGSEILNLKLLVNSLNRQLAEANESKESEESK